MIARKEDSAMKKTNAESMKAFRERQAAKGLKYVQVWIPAEAEARLRAYAKRLRTK